MSETKLNKIIAATTSNQDQVLIETFRFEDNTNFENELLFFFKPETFLVRERDGIASILQMVFDKLNEYKVSISGVLLLNGSRLDELGIMDKHYGYINKLSKGASSLLTESDIKIVQNKLGLDDLTDYKILGGHEFLKEFDEFSVEALKLLWHSKKTLKLRSGFYFQQYKAGNEQVVLINGFHPEQLSHFTLPTHKVIVLLLHSNTGWEVLKNDLAGATYPEQAVPASIRGELYTYPDRYGIEDVSIANNFVHLSAGPFEALYEILNFLEDIDSIDFELSNTNLAKKMSQRGISSEEINSAVGNPRATMDGKLIDLFTATENFNSSDAISLYLEHFV